MGRLRRPAPDREQRRRARADRRRNDAVGSQRVHRDPRRSARARLRLDPLGRLPAPAARARRPGTDRRLVVPRRLLHRGGRLHELDLSEHRVVGAYDRRGLPRPRGDLVAEAAGGAGGDPGLLRERRRQHGPLGSPPLDRVVAGRQPRPRAACRPARRGDAGRADLHQERDGGAQPRDLRAGRRRRPDRDDDPRAQLGDAPAAPPRADAAAARSRSCRRTATPASSTSTSGRPRFGAPGPVPRRRHARLERHRRRPAARSDGGGRERGGRAAGRRRLADRRARPVRAAGAGAPRPWRCPATRACSARRGPACSTSRRASRSSR